MSTKRKQRQSLRWPEVLGRLVYGLLGALSSMLCIMGYYPLVPAFYAGCCFDQRKNYLLYIGLFTGMGFCMPVGAMVKYLFVLLVTGIAIHFYRWANRRCSGVTAGLISGLATAAMNCSGAVFYAMDRKEFVLGISEGVCVFGAAVLFHYVSQMSYELGQTILQSPKDDDQGQQQTALDEAQGRIHAFAEAVDGLSVAFAAMGSRSEFSGHESVTVLEQEITGKLCGACDACAVCWNDKTDLSAKIRRMLQAVVAHNPKEEILDQNYMEECPRYPGMVEEAIWAFSRMELNEAWYRRLQENRMVIAGQLDAMADALQDWNRDKKNVDAKSKLLLARVGFEALERGLVVENVHIYEDDHGRRSISAMVSSKWGGGIPSKNYRKALERATGLALRLQKDARAILTQDAVPITAYEDTCYYALSGVAAEAKDGASMNGDNFSLFTSENGRYHICLSDGMGSGPAASKESDMVVDLMEKFMEAGFPRDTAIHIMNSAMVLKGENDTYSTLDFAVVDLYTGELELTKIGAAASFIRHRQEVRYIPGGSLPTGAEATKVDEPVCTRLTNGDFLVMVTDGVLEYLHVKNPEEKLSEMISEIKTENAGVLARQLMERVMLFTGGHALDDMTIVVTGIWEK